MMTREHYTSVEEFCNAPFKLEYNRKRCQDEHWTEHGFIPRAIRSNLGTNWLGPDNPTIAQAVDRVLHGWKEGAEKVRHHLAAIEINAPVSVKRKRKRSDQGDDLDIHAVYRGDLEHAWTKRQRSHTRARRTVRIVAQCNLLANTNADELFWRGAAVCKLVDVLSDAGYSVEVIGAIASVRIDHHEHAWLLTFPLKEAESPLDMEQLAGIACNSGFHRLYGFRAYYARCDWNRAHIAGTDHSDDSSRLTAAVNFNADGTQTFTVPYHVGDATQAQAWLAKCCTEIDNAQ